MEPLTWSAYEHEHKDRGNDWYVALGVITLCTALTALIFSNFFFALLIITAATTLGLLASQPPALTEFALSDQGLLVGDTFHPFHEMYAFWIQEQPERFLMIDTPRWMAPDIIIPLPADIDSNTVRAFFKDKTPEVPMHEPLGYRVLEMFGF